MTKNAFHTLTYGLYIVSSRLNDKLNGYVSNTVFQTTVEPNTITICTNKNNLTCEFIKKNNFFSVSVLGEDIDKSIIGLFGFKSGKNINKFENIKYKLGLKQTPIVLQEGIISYFECEVINIIDVYTHIIYVGKVIDNNFLQEQSPLTYSKYLSTKNNVKPSLIKGGVEQSETGDSLNNVMNKKYICNVCGYIYDPSVGDEEHKIKPGTDFNDLPNDWECPLCGAKKDSFSVLSN